MHLFHHGTQSQRPASQWWEPHPSHGKDTPALHPHLHAWQFSRLQAWYACTTVTVHQGRSTLPAVMVSVLNPCRSHPPPHILHCSQLVKLPASFTWLSWRLEAVCCLPALCTSSCTSPIALGNLVLKWPCREPHLWLCSPVGGPSSGFSQALSRDNSCSSEVPRWPLIDILGTWFWVPWTP